MTQLHLQGAGKMIDLPFTMIHKKHSKHNNAVLMVRFGEYAYSCKGYSSSFGSFLLSFLMFFSFFLSINLHLGRLYNIVKNFIPNALYQDHGLGRLCILIQIFFIFIFSYFLYLCFYIFMFLYFIFLYFYTFIFLLLYFF